VIKKFDPLIVIMVPPTVGPSRGVIYHQDKNVDKNKKLST